MRDQLGFVILDAVMCAFAALCLTVLHPSWCLRQMTDADAQGTGEGKSVEQDL